MKKKIDGVLRETLTSCRSETIYVSLEATTAMERYSPSAFDRATVGCFFAFQDTHLE